MVADDGSALLDASELVDAPTDEATVEDEWSLVDEAEIASELLDELAANNGGAPLDSSELEYERADEHAKEELALLQAWALLNRDEEAELKGREEADDGTVDGVTDDSDELLDQVGGEEATELLH